MPLSGCWALSYELSTSVLCVPAWTKYSHFPEVTVLLLAPLPCLHCFPFLNSFLFMPCPQFFTHSSVLSSNGIIFGKTPFPLPCLQIGLNTLALCATTLTHILNILMWDYIYIPHIYIVSAWRIGIGISQGRPFINIFEIIN